MVLVSGKISVPRAEWKPEIKESVQKGLGIQGVDVYELDSSIVLEIVGVQKCQEYSTERVEAFLDELLKTSLSSGEFRFQSGMDFWRWILEEPRNLQIRYWHYQDGLLVFADGIG